MKLNPDGTPKTSVPRDIARVAVHNAKHLTAKAARQVTGKGKKS